MNIHACMALAALALSFPASSMAAPVPTINFDGSLGYSYNSVSNTGLLEVRGQITGTEGLSAAAVASIGTLSATSVLLQATWRSTTVVGSGFLPEIVGVFDPTGALDLVIEAADGTVLVQGNIATPAGLTLSGPEGLTFGSLLASITPTGGSLGGSFTDPSSVLALVLNMSAAFSADLFTTSFSGGVGSGGGGLSFSGQADGEFSGGPVPLPGAALFLVSALGAVFGLSRPRRPVHA